MIRPISELPLARPVNRLWLVFVYSALSMHTAAVYDGTWFSGLGSVLWGLLALLEICDLVVLGWDYLWANYPRAR